MSSLNEVKLIGRVGQNPEIRSAQNGNKIANLRMATSEKWKDKNTGEVKENTDWHNVVVLNDGLVRVIEQYVSKGSRLYISGKLQTRKYQASDGSDRYVTEIVLKGFGSEMIMLDSKNDSSQTHKGFNSQGDIPQNNDMDDELPF